MGGDWSNTLVEYGAPAGQRHLLFTDGYRKKALRKLWMGWGIGFALLLCSAILSPWSTFVLFAALSPALAAFLFMDLRFWRKVRFCPACEAVVHWPGWNSKMAFCFNCGRLVDPAKVLVDPPGVVNLTDDRYRDEGQPVVKIIAMVILIGIKDRATEIRFEPGREESQLRCRCEGLLYDMVPPPNFISKYISATLKAMVGLAPERRPQIGTLQIQLDDSPIEARLETTPTEFGEDVIVWLPELHDSPKQAESLLGRYVQRMDK